MGRSLEEAKLAVQTGYWPLYRYNPTLKEEGKNPFILDYKKEPDGTLDEFLLGENRYAQLEKAKPELAKKMRATLAQQYQERFDELTELSK